MFGELFVNSTGKTLSVSGGFISSMQDSSQKEPFRKLTCGLLWLFIFAAPFELRLSYGGISLPGLVGYCSFAFGLLGVLWSNKLIEPSLRFLLLLAFCVWSTMSIAWSDYPDRTLSKVLIYWGLLGFVALMTQYALSRRIRLSLLGAYVVGCWCGVASVLVSYLSGMQYQGLAGRYSSAFGDPNFLALALVIGVPIAVHRGAGEVVAWRRLLFFGYVPAAIVGVIVTGSRGAALALLAAGVATAMCSINRIRMKWLFVVLAVCLGIVYALPPNAMARLQTIPDELQNGTLSGRRVYWDYGSNLVARHPLVGLGTGAGDAAVSAMIGTDKVVHSTPLEVAMDGGVVGLMLFYGAVLCSLISVWRFNYAERTLLLAVSAAWLVGSLSLSWEDHKVTWFILGFLVSAVPQHWQERLQTAGVSSGLSRSRLSGMPRRHPSFARSAESLD
jgi:hypothetical protein